MEASDSAFGGVSLPASERADREGPADGSVEKACSPPHLLDRIAASWVLAFVVMSVLCAATFSPVLRGLHTPEFTSHYYKIIRQARGAPRGLEFVTWEARKWGKFRPLPALLHLGLLEAGGPYSPLRGVATVLSIVLAGFFVFLALRTWSNRGTALKTALLFMLVPTRQSANTAVYSMSLERVIALVFILACYALWWGALTTASTRLRRVLTASGVVVYLLALLSKESIMLLPLVFPFVASLSPDRRPRRRTMIARLIPLIVTLVVFLGVRLALRSEISYGLPDQEAPPTLARVGGNLLIAGGQLLGAQQPSSAVSAAAWGVIILAHLMLPTWRARLAGMLWIMLSLGPHLLQQYFGANYVYTAVPWVCFLAVTAVERALGHVRALNRRSTAVWVCAVVVMCVFTFRATRREAAPWAAVSDAARAVQRVCPRRAYRLAFLVVGAREEWGIKHAQVLSRLTGVPLDRVSFGSSTDLGGLGENVIQGRSLGLRWALRIGCATRGTSGGQ